MTAATLREIVERAIIRGFHAKPYEGTLSLVDSQIEGMADQIIAEHEAAQAGGGTGENDAASEVRGGQTTQAHARELIGASPASSDESSRPGTGAHAGAARSAQAATPVSLAAAHPSHAEAVERVVAAAEAWRATYPRSFPVAPPMRQLETNTLQALFAAVDALRSARGKV